MGNIKEILQRDDARLRLKSKELSIDALSSEKIKKIIEEMKATLKSQEDGVAIAAPQIGHQLRIFVVSGKIFEFIKIQKNNKERSNIEFKEIKTDILDEVFINPKIIKASKKRKWLEEGCLSVRWLYGKVNRTEKVTIEALDDNGEKIKKGATGLLAQIFQHETDHLDGVLFIDKAIDLEEIKPELSKEKTV